LAARGRGIAGSEGRHLRGAPRLIDAGNRGDAAARAQMLDDADPRGVRLVDLVRREDDDPVLLPGEDVAARFPEEIVDP
jgi:hypothetical protein